MSYELDSMQRLLLWRLAVSDDGEFKKDVDFVTAAKRKALAREGYIAEGKRKDPNSGRDNIFLSLEDKGWSWCQEHMTDEFKSTSKKATNVLELLLKRLAIYFQSQDHTRSFGQFILQTRQTKTEQVETPPQAEPPSSIPVPLEDSIRAACLQLGNGQRNVRVRLADLRPKLAVAHAVLDEKLLEMERSGELSLYPLDNPQEIGPADREAALRTQTGHERHIVYFSGKA